MNSPQSLSRRHLIQGLGVAGVATTSGLTRASIAAAEGDGPNDGVDEYVSTAPFQVEAVNLPTPIVQAITATDFIGLSSSTYAYVSPGGFQVTSAGTWFDADLRIPVGATITGASVYLNPNGATRFVQVVRYTPIPPAFENLAANSSSNGIAVEAVPLALTHVVEAGWNYRLGQVRLDVGGAILYGGEVRYTVPPDPQLPPSGHFVPFAGVNPRVYDSRTGGLKLTANEERVIPLGVPGTAQAAVFNITVTQTQAQGFVSCFRADIAFPGNSSVNWYEPGADSANLVVCAVDASGQIRIRGGRDSTHVVIDLIGTFA